MIVERERGEKWDMYRKSVKRGSCDYRRRM